MEPKAKGPYEIEDVQNLDRVNNLYNGLLDEFDELRESSETKLINDPETLDSLLKIAKALSDNVHKTVNATSKHDIGSALVESAEDRMEFLKELHSGASEAYNGMVKEVTHILPDNLLPTPVDGQLDVGINKNTLKEIMDVKIVDEDED